MSTGFYESDAAVEQYLLFHYGTPEQICPLLPEARSVLNATGAPLVSGRATAESGLFFCGAIPSALGQLRQIGVEAQGIADAVAREARAA